MKKVNHIMNKNLVIYTKKNLVLLMMINSEIIVILVENIGELLIMLPI